MFRNCDHMRKCVYRELLKYNLNIKSTKLRALFKKLFNAIQILCNKFY